MSDKYILIGQTPVPVEPCGLDTPEGTAGYLDWARWMETADCRVGFTRVLGICYVSTVFLGMDHGFMRGGNAPVLFESMAFWNGDGGNEQRRACTWAGAEKTHRYMVEEVSRPRAVLSYVGRVIQKYWRDAREDWVRGWRELRGLGPERTGDALVDSMRDSMDRMQELIAERQEEEWRIYG